jgi:hypothetical protein
MNARWLAAAIVIVVGAAGCGYSIKAKSNYDPRVSWSRYGTFFMLNGNSSGDPQIDERLNTDVRSTLAAKGWVEVPKGEGQAAVIVHTATPAQHSYDHFYDGWGGWRLRWDGFQAPAGFVEDYKVGTVVVTIFDADTRTAIWRGFVPDVISGNDKHSRKISEEAVQKLFDNFPPEASGD